MGTPRPSAWVFPVNCQRHFIYFCGIVFSLLKKSLARLAILIDAIQAFLAQIREYFNEIIRHYRPLKTITIF
jgi:hypothetical protein